MTETLENRLKQLGEKRSGHLLCDGEIIGDYTVNGFLGSGGSGEVYRATHNSADSHVAIKIFYRNDAKTTERMTREIGLLTTLFHPSLPRYFGSGEHKGMPFLIYEELHVRELPEEEGKVARLLIQLCDCLDVLHTAGFVHRDIKPQNILYRADGTPVIIDFGIVKRASKVIPSAMGTISVVDGVAVGVGTPGYAAPEQFQGEEITPAADTHALGVIADRCFKGAPPKPWKAAILHATSSTPGKRYRSVRDLSVAIKRRNLRRVPALATPLPAVIAVLIVGLMAYAMIRTISKSGNDGEESGISLIERLEGGDKVLFLKTNGAEVRTALPVFLRSGQKLIVEGPGSLHASVNGEKDSVVTVSGCTLCNETKDLPTDKMPRYILEEGAELTSLRGEKTEKPH